MPHVNNKDPQKVRTFSQIKLSCSAHCCHWPRPCWLLPRARCDSPADTVECRPWAPCHPWTRTRQNRHEGGMGTARDLISVPRSDPRTAPRGSGCVVAQHRPSLCAFDTPSRSDIVVEKQKKSHIIIVKVARAHGRSDAARAAAHLGAPHAAQDVREPGGWLEPHDEHWSRQDDTAQQCITVRQRSGEPRGLRGTITAGSCPPTAHDSPPQTRTYCPVTTM